MNDTPAMVPGDMPPTPPPEAPRGAMARLRTYFLTGLIVAGPIAITFYLTWWFVTWVDGIVRPFVPIAYQPETYLPFGLPGSGLIVAVFALTMLGFLTANLIGRTLVDLGEGLLGRMPVVRAIYRGLKQVFETLFSGNTSSFRRVGLVVSLARHVVDRADLAAAEHRGGIAAAGSGRASVGVPAVLAEPDHRLLLLRAEEQGDRDRHERRAGGHADHVGRRGAARQRGAEEGPRAGRDGPQCRRGEDAGRGQGGVGGRWLPTPAPSSLRAKRSNPVRTRCRHRLDCFVAEPVPGRRVAPIRVLLAMTRG